MKLLQVNASYKPAYIYGGPTMSVSKLSEEMVKAGNQVDVFTTTANGTEELPVAPNQPVDVDGVRVTYFERRTKDHSHYSPELFRKLKQEARNFDVVHIHAWWNLVSVFSCFIALRKGVPVVVSPRGTLSMYSFTNKNNLTKKLLHNLLGKRLLKKCHIHVTSGREQMAMETLINPESIFNIPNFIALPGELPARVTLDGDYIKLIFFSRIEEKKGLEILIEALSKVRVPYRLTIAGDGEPAYVNALKSLAEEKDISDKIDWIGFQKDNKFDLLQWHDLMVLPSYDENFGNVVIESLSVGTPVLISNNVGLADYVNQNNLGWVCDNDPQSFGGSIVFISGERARLTEIRQQAPAQIRKDFDEAALANRYMDMYKKIAGNG